MTATERETEQAGFWAILELMGHVRLFGYLTEESKFGTALGRIDIPDNDGGMTTQYFGGSSIYRITPTTEEIARRMARNYQPMPVHSWELPQLREAAPSAPLDNDWIGDEGDDSE